MIGSVFWFSHDSKYGVVVWYPATCGALLIIGQYRKGCAYRPEA